MKNERIRELMELATVQVDPDDREWVFFKVDQAKFAELIVEKCAQASEVYWNDAGLQRAFSPSEYIYTILEVE